MWDDLDPESADIYSVYSPLAQKSSEFKRPWSVAELKLSQEDIDWLTRWFIELPHTVSLASDGLPGYVLPSEMVAALLIVLGSERCRRFSSEDSVWPVLSGIIPRSHPLRAKIFLSDGQPTYLFKQAINEATNALNMRNSLGVEGTQQWFVTIKLQYGFTIKGAKRRLAEWLVGYGTTSAIEYLSSASGPLASRSFQYMWMTLRQYRRGLIGESEARETLLSSPWIEPDWINDILIEAVRHIDIPEPGESVLPNCLGSESSFLDQRGPLENIILTWPADERPRVGFQLSRDSIESECKEANCSEIDFFVDGIWTKRWISQADGTWEGSNFIPADSEKGVNLFPKILSIYSGNRNLIKQFNLTDFGLQGDVLVFNLDDQRLNKFGIERLNPDRHYVLICDKAHQIEGCNVIREYEEPNSSWKAVQLPYPLIGNIRLSYEGFVIWQSVAPQMEAKALPIVMVKTLNDQMTPVGEQVRLCLEGLPIEATETKMLMGKLLEPIENCNGDWITSRQITISPELALGQKKIRIRFSLDAKSITLIPKRAFRLKGLATYKRGQQANPSIRLSLIEPGDTIRRTSDGAQLRIWAPDRATRVRVFEGHNYVGPLRNGSVYLRDLSGLGGQLNIKGEVHHIFDNSCQDTGWIKTVMPMGAGMPAHVCLDMKRQPNLAEHKLIAWTPRHNGRSELESLPSSSLLTTHNSRDWKIFFPSNAFSLAVTYKGLWCGASWWPGKLLQYSFLPLTSFFAAARWFRLPILKPEILPWFDSLVQANPAAFLEAWICDRGLPPSVRRQDNEPAFDTVIRQFIGRWRPNSNLCVQAVGLLVAGSEPHNYETLLNSVDKVRRYSLPLLWWISHKLASVSKLYLQTAISSMLRLGDDQSERLLSIRLNELKLNIAEYCIFSLGRVDELTRSIIFWLEHPGEILSAQDYDDMLSVLSSESGQKYLAVKVLLTRISGQGKTR